VLFFPFLENTIVIPLSSKTLAVRSRSKSIAEKRFTASAIFLREGVHVDFGDTSPHKANPFPLIFGFLDSMADEVMGDFISNQSELIELKLPLIGNLQVDFPHSTHLSRLLDQPWTNLLRWISRRRNLALSFARHTPMPPTSQSRFCKRWSETARSDTRARPRDHDDLASLGESRGVGVD
jgi:hypothetical protein